MTYTELCELIDIALSQVKSTDVAWNIKYSEPSVEEEILEVHLLVGDELIQETYVDADWDEVAEKLKPLLEYRRAHSPSKRSLGGVSEAY